MNVGAEVVGAKVVVGADEGVTVGREERDGVEEGRLLKLGSDDGCDDGSNVTALLLPKDANRVN